MFYLLSRCNAVWPPFPAGSAVCACCTVRLRDLALDACMRLARCAPRYLGVTRASAVSKHSLEHLSLAMFCPNRDARAPSIPMRPWSWLRIVSAGPSFVYIGGLYVFSKQSKRRPCIWTRNARICDRSIGVYVEMDVYGLQRTHRKRP